MSAEARLQVHTHEAGRHASQARMFAGVGIFVLCVVAGVVGGFVADFWRHGETVARNIGTGVTLAAAAVWVLSLLMLLRAHWRAVRRSWEGSRPLTEAERSTWQSQSKASLFVGALGVLLVWPSAPFATIFRAPIIIARNLGFTKAEPEASKPGPGKP